MPENCFYAKPNQAYTIGGIHYASNLSTEKTPEEKGPRLQKKDVHRKRKKGSCPPPCKGARTPFGIVKVKNTVSLNQNTLFKRLYYRGKVEHSPILIMHSMPNGLGYNRFGITVSKKIGKAVKRNKVRRRIYEAFRLYEPSIKKGLDIVIVAKASALEADFERYYRVIGGMIKKAGLFI
ncbi:MAG: Ribonuclease P protein component [Firmicutes bacterium ADurb.Bin193]|nr:MAG: Ribonuclease P protein component [Firmicutes bacterium ADurb.Bin193]